MRVLKRYKVVAVVGVLSCALFRGSLHSQKADDAGLQMSTQERMEIEPWWPTANNTDLSKFAGSASCARCHQDETARGPATSMQRAAELGSESTFLKGKTSGKFLNGSFTYSIAANANGIDYTVSDGSHKVSRSLDWVMGAGELGRTFVYQADGRWYQSEATFYTKPSTLDLTTGLSGTAGTSPGSDLASALGEVLSADDARHCFNCHTVHATTVRGFNPLHAEAGLGCEACHGPSLAHVTAMNAAGAGTGAAHARPQAFPGVFNPAKLSPADSIDFCGACHRASADVVVPADQPPSTAIVRFQPYRLEESKCWRTTMDARLTCVACHNPHEPLNRNVAAYDRHCLECHAAGAAAASAGEHAGKVCPTAASNCTSCHMPKVTITSMHGQFTDHFIRVVRPGEGFPR